MSKDELLVQAEKLKKTGYGQYLLALVAE
jgi:hypothetical protein